MNESLRRAMLRARLREDDIAAHLGVDPKTIRRWLSGRVPYPASRVALAALLGADEAELWPESGGPLSAKSRPKELAAVYAHRRTISLDAWERFFNSAEHEIGILAYSALFLAENARLLGIIKEKVRKGAQLRLALSDPDNPSVAPNGHEETIGDPASRKIHNALNLYRPLLKSGNVKIRLHRTILYNSIYHADDRLFINQHTYGLPNADAPVFCFRRSESEDLFAAYLDSFERVWSTAREMLAGTYQTLKA